MVFSLYARGFLPWKQRKNANGHIFFFLVALIVFWTKRKSFAIFWFSLKNKQKSKFTYQLITIQHVQFNLHIPFTQRQQQSTKHFHSHGGNKTNNLLYLMFIKRDTIYFAFTNLTNNTLINVDTEITKCIPMSPLKKYCSHHVYRLSHRAK